MHIAVEVSHRRAAVAVEGAIRIVQPQGTAAALQRVAVSVVERVGKGDIAGVLAHVVDSVPTARVLAINPHN